MEPRTDTVVVPLEKEGFLRANHACLTDLRMGIPITGSVETRMVGTRIQVVDGDVGRGHFKPYYVRISIIAAAAPLATKPSQKITLRDQRERRMTRPASAWTPPCTWWIQRRRGGVSSYGDDHAVEALGGFSGFHKKNYRN